MILIKHFFFYLFQDVRIQLALLRMDFEIKKSLRVDHTDVNYCCLIMQDLIKLPFVKSHLFITPVIVDTIKKVCFSINF